MVQAIQPGSSLCAGSSVAWSVAEENLERSVRYGISWIPRLKRGRRRVNDCEGGEYSSEFGIEERIERS